jgi:hypothetical protein
LIGFGFRNSQLKTGLLGSVIDEKNDLATRPKKVRVCQRTAVLD